MTKLTSTSLLILIKINAINLSGATFNCSYSVLVHCIPVYPEADWQLVRKSRMLPHALVSEKLRSTRTTQLLKELLRLPIRQRSQIKGGCPMPKVKHKNASSYLQKLCRLSVNSANPIRREMFRLLTVRTNFQKRAFENSGCHFGNGLTSYLRIASKNKVLENMLKTMLFCQAYWLILFHI